MLPNIDPTNNSANVGAVAGQSQVKRPEVDKALEAYGSSPSQAKPAEQVRSRDSVQQREAREAQKTAEGSPASRTAKSKTDTYLKQGQDQAEINFQLTREERAVFLNAMSGREDPSEMTEEEQGTLQRASERIEKFIEEASTRRTDRSDRLEKAIKEWYTRLSNGKHKAPSDLVRLIQQAAAGNVDFKNIGELS